MCLAATTIFSSEPCSDKLGLLTKEIVPVHMLPSQQRQFRLVDFIQPFVFAVCSFARLLP